MTDMEKYVGILTDFGIRWEMQNPSPDYIVIEIEVPWKGHTNILGYTGFNCAYTFDVFGKFVNVGIWE